MQGMLLLPNQNWTKDFIKHLMREPWRLDMGIKVYFESFKFQLCKWVLGAKAKLHIDVIPTSESLGLSVINTLSYYSSRNSWATSACILIVINLHCSSMSRKIYKDEDSIKGRPKFWRFDKLPKLIYDLKLSHVWLIIRRNWSELISNVTNSIFCRLAK